MDAGSFSLSLKRLPLRNLLCGRMKLYFLLSRKSRLNLRIEDSVAVSEYCEDNNNNNNNTNNNNNDDDGKQVLDLLPLPSLYLNIDINRIDQVI